MGVCNQFPLELDDEPSKKRNPFAAANSDEENSDDEENAGLDADRLAEEMELLEELGLDGRKFQCFVVYILSHSSVLSVFIDEFIVDITKKPKDELKKLLEKKKQELLDQFDEFADELPANTLDTLVNQLGGPTRVAEVCIVSVSGNVTRNDRAKIR